MTTFEGDKIMAQIRDELKTPQIWKRTKDPKLLQIIYKDHYEIYRLEDRTKIKDSEDFDSILRMTEGNGFKRVRI